ncbi:MAG: hypothetical protein WD872_10760 [Pirellulaceae bacterium]
MTATCTAEPRRQGSTPSAPKRELPVLFHLIDVSRPKGYTAPPVSLDLVPASPPPRYEPAFELPEPTLERPEPEPHFFAPQPFEPLDHNLDHDNLDRDAATADESAPIAPESFASAAAEAPDEWDVVPESLAEQTPAEEVPPEVENPPVDAVSLRQRAAARQRNRQTTARDDWFTTHGKYIAVGFVLALLVTVYLARTNRHEPAPPIADLPHAHPGDAGHEPHENHARPTVASETSPAAAITQLGPTTEASGPRAAALHPPTIPQLAQQPAESRPAGGDNLFSFGKRAEERVAARTDAKPAPALLEAGRPASPAPAAPPLPEVQPQYPTTPYRGEYPTAPTAAAPPPAQPPAVGPTLNPSASNQPIYPQTNTARGYRHERTGSSLY